MPNHTDNRVILSHDDSLMIDKIYNIMNTEDTELCQTILPMDEKLLDGGDWYEWRLDNWGTKWDIYDSNCDRIDANTLQLLFYTAWSPPTGIFDKLVDMGYDVHARYLDEGWRYIGMYDNGEVTEFSNEDYMRLEGWVEDVIKECPELDEEFDIRGMIEESIV